VEASFEPISFRQGYFIRNLSGNKIFSHTKALFSLKKWTKKDLEEEEENCAFKASSNKK